MSTKLNKDIYTKVLIIGGGITGMSTLYHLNKEGIDSVLIERNVCGSGVTSKSTAKINFLQDNTIINIATLRTEELAKKYLNSQIYATKLLVNIIEKEKIKCDLREVESYLFTNTKSGCKKLTELKELLKQEDVSVEECKTVPFNELNVKAIKVSETYVFHPLKYINQLKNKFMDKIYEHSKVDRIEKKDNLYVASVGSYKITAQYVVLATHYPYFLLPYLFPLKSRVEVSYLGAKKVKDFSSYTAITLDKPTKSMRYHSDGENNYFIYLLNSHISCNVGNVEENFDNLKSIHKFDYVWSNNDILTGDYMPYVGQIDNDENFMIATGYNTWGMTNGTLAGKILSDKISGKENEYGYLFDPRRSFNFAKAINYPIDILSSVKAFLISTKGNSNNSKVTYTKRDGKNVAIYKDEKGVEHIVLNRCPHMKCGIVLNEEEGTWDCLCHGSRFDLDGKCIEGPANEDISFKPKKDRSN